MNTRISVVVPALCAISDLAAFTVVLSVLTVGPLLRKEQHTTRTS